MVEAHTVTIAPHFRSLSAGEIERSAAGEVVTVADRACERHLGPLLRDLVDGPILGEEAAAADPSLLDLVAAPGPVWLVDPIDGTADFAAGSPEYAVMVALLEGGVTLASWILQPEFDRLAVAVRGGGATIDGRAVTMAETDLDPTTWRGVIKDRFVPEELRATVAGSGLGPSHRGGNCAGVEYPALVEGQHHFLFYWRTRPWDHAPGALLATETGGRAIRPDGRDYRPDEPGDGLIVAHTRIVDAVAERLLQV